MTMGRGGDEGWAGLKDGVFVPVLYGFFLPHPYPAPPNEENFLTPSPSLEAHEA